MENIIRTLIIEDESPARRLIENFLQEYPQVKLIGHCSDGFEGAKKIMELKPDLIFLDIQMPRINGFEMLELLKGEDLPMVIFTTAFDEFAIRSFEYNTCDYLLKPIGKERFQKAVQKAIEQFRIKEKDSTPLEEVSEQGMTAGKFLDRIVIRSGSNIHVVQCDDLICLEASDDYVIVHSTSDQWLKKQTLKFYEKKLNPEEFVRVHRSFVVKVSAINRIEPYSKDAYVALLHNGLKASVSKAGYARLKQILNF